MTGLLPAVTELHRKADGEQLLPSLHVLFHLRTPLKTSPSHPHERLTLLVCLKHYFLLLKGLSHHIRNYRFFCFVLLKEIFRRCNSLSQSSAPLLFNLGPAKWLPQRSGERRPSAINKNAALGLERRLKHWLRALFQRSRVHSSASKNPTALYRQTCRQNAYAHKNVTPLTLPRASTP